MSRRARWAVFLAGIGTGVAATVAASSALRGRLPAPIAPASEAGPEEPSEPSEEESPPGPPEQKPEQKEEAGPVDILPRITFGVSVVLAGIVLWYLFTNGLRTVPGPEWQVPGGDPARGRQAILRYGCGSCHTIPGLRDATGRVGPQLTDFKEQTYIAGQLPNVPHHLVEWIQDPQRFAPGTAMPDLGVTEAQARDMAAYLYNVSRR